MKNITNFDFKELNKFNKVYCLVSGGIDSTYLYEMIKQEVDNSKVSSFLRRIRVGLDIGTGKYINREPSFYYRHKEGILYCYPYRDYKVSRELPEEIIKQLRVIYPDLSHSGCSYCPVLVVFRDRIIKNADEQTKKRLKSSLIFYNKMRFQKLP